MRRAVVASLVVAGVAAIPQVSFAATSSNSSVTALFGPGCKVETVASSPNMTAYLSNCEPKFSAVPHGATYSQQSNGVNGIAPTTVVSPYDGVPGAVCNAITDGNECVGLVNNGASFVGSFTNHTSATVYGGNGLYQGACVGNSQPVSEPATNIPPGYTYLLQAGPAYANRPITSKFFSYGVYFGAVCTTFYLL